MKSITTSSSDALHRFFQKQETVNWNAFIAKMLNELNPDKTMLYRLRQIFNRFNVLVTGKGRVTAFPMTRNKNALYKVEVKKMKRYLIYALLFFPALILANSYSVQIQFPFPREGFSSSALYEQGYGFYIAPGALQLPVKQINILLPKDAIVNDWQLTFDPDITFKGEAPIFNSAFTNGEEILGAPIKRNNPSRYNFLGLRKWGI